MATGSMAGPETARLRPYSHTVRPYNTIENRSSRAPRMCTSRRITLTIVFLATTSVRPHYTELVTKEHKTQGATIPKNDLSCYTCDTAQDGLSCHNLSLHNNPTSFIKKCLDDKRICVVKKFSYQVSTENSTNKPKLWSLQRNCTSKCEPGCIIIGERTKILACTFCCTLNACNSMMGKSPSPRSFPMLTLLISVLIPIKFYLYM